MTIDAVLGMARRAGIWITSDGEYLRYDAPTGALTQALRHALVQHKPTLIRALAPARDFITLRGGLTLPVDVVMLGLDLEARGVALATDADHRLVLDLSDSRLTDFEQAAIARWERHLAALVEYTAPEVVR